MQFLLIAYDATDPEAPERRLKSRPEHLEKIANVRKAGHFLFGGAILDDNEKMIGSVILYETADREELDKLKFGYTGIWWYARYPNHYASDVARPDKKLGELLIQSWGGQLAELVKYLKNNNSVEQLQEEFYRRAEDPLK